METDNMTDDARDSSASRGSHGSGITERLRGWARADDSVWPSELMGEAAGEIDRLRLTDEEREAIWTVAEAYAENDGDPECQKIARIMQGLWHRTK
jgi:hypothetical protein